MAYVLRRPSARCRIEYMDKPVSTTLTVGDVVTVQNDTDDSSFDVMGATSATILGVVGRSVNAADSNYASLVKWPLLMDEDGIWEVSVSTGTPTASYVGYYVDVDNTSIGQSVDVSAQTESHFLITGFISATSVLGKITTWSGSVSPVTAD